MPNIRFALATMAFPVPRSLVGNNSGETAYNTPYITLLVKLYPQFHPSSALDVRAVVDARMNTPVRAGSNLVDTASTRRVRMAHTCEYGKGTAASEEW